MRNYYFYVFHADYHFYVQNSDKLLINMKNLIIFCRIRSDC